MWVIRSTNPARKAELNAVAMLPSALADWDSLQHRTALNKPRDLPKHVHNLEAALGRTSAQVLPAATRPSGRSP